MEENLENAQNIQKFYDKKNKSSSWKTWLSGILIGLGILIFLCLYIFIGEQIVSLLGYDEYFSEISLIVILLSIIIFVIMMIKIFYTHDKKNESSSGKRRVKWILIVLGFIVGFWLLGLFGIFLYTKYGDIPGGGCYCEGDVCQCLDKPIIYLYPTKETEIHIELGTPENLSHTYPKYNSEKGRNVIAQPNGDLEDIDTGRKLYALYREGKSYNKTNFDEGFIVAGKDIVPFLEEKLAILGLNEREAEEFIVYWLPQMENNEWNLIRFETKAEQDGNMSLNITPKPDTVIRVMMDWKAIDELIDIPEQQLETPERNGFTVVEWGGSPKI